MIRFLNKKYSFQKFIYEGQTAFDEIILYLSIVRVLQTLKNALGLPLRLGWNGDPCVPQQHPWSGADCHFDGASSKWFIDGLYCLDPGLAIQFYFVLSIV